MNRVRTVAYFLAIGVVATVAGALASLPFDGRTALIVWAVVAATVAVTAGVLAGGGSR